MVRRLFSWGRLWSHKDFTRLWTSETIGAFGRQVTALALPTVAILLLNANPFQMGVLYALEDLAFPIFGLFVGVWADRVRRRPIMIVANLGRMIAVGSVPLVFLFAVFLLGAAILGLLSHGEFSALRDVWAGGTVPLAALLLYMRGSERYGREEGG